MPEYRHACVAGLCCIQTDFGLALPSRNEPRSSTKALIAVKFAFAVSRRSFPVTRTEPGARMWAANVPSTVVGQSLD